MSYQIHIPSLKPVFQTIPAVSTDWNFMDYVGNIKVRLGIGRNHYTVAPGLYKAGNPTSESVVLVSANYKLSFDILRENLKSLDDEVAGTFHKIAIPADHLANAPVHLPMQHNFLPADQ